MDIAQQKRNAKEFIERWSTADRGREKQDSQSFWLDLLENVLGVEKPTEFIRFEKTVKLSHESFIDGYIDQTKVMIEQKGSSHDLSKAIKQSDGSLLTPFQQAQRYAGNLPYSERPRWIVTCNFVEFRVYDMEHPNSEPTIIKLEDLEKNYYQLEFLVDKSNQHLEKEKQVSLDAGELVGKIYNELLKQYIEPNSERSQRSINQLSVRLVFCLYAEDAGIFGKKNMFHDYLAEFSARDMRQALIKLFKVLDTKVEDRDPYLASDNPKLAEFPYVNGGMFSDEDIEIPPFTEKLKDLLLRNASDNFDWSEISPTIFGAVFESTLNPETRRQGGMHYTSVENIHKVIDPLFLDSLKDELNEIKKTKQPATLKKKARAFQEKLSHLTFFDPACGSGNFLTETYLSLRKLENEAIRLETGGQGSLDVGQLEDTVLVSIQNFYGIEINDFAVSVAKTALWIAESQMLEATKEIVYANDWEFLPLKTYTNIHEGNAVRMNWNEVLPNYACSYIMGNPPFVANNARSKQAEGSSFGSMSKEQKEDRKSIFGKKGDVLDYVSCWFALAAKYIKGTNIQCAFVSTNSIVQGQQAIALWEPLLLKEKLHINFAYQSFKWISEASSSGTVYVVIIGFSYVNNKEKIIYSNGQKYLAKNINGYLNDAPNLFIKARRKPLNTKLTMRRGSQPTDHGNLILSEKEASELKEKYPKLKPYIRRFMMGNDFINGKKRYCLWFKNVEPAVLKISPEVVERIKNVRDFRLNSSKAATRKKAETPYLFDEIKDSQTNYIAFPIISSGNRRYIPIGYLDKSVIAGNKLFEAENASLYDFGILTSNVHMAWTRETCSWYGPSYSYSNTIVFNNFPWPNPTDNQKKKIEQTAQAILDAREKYSNSSLADLYDDLTMPIDLRKAHQENDRAVMAAYGMPVKGTTESDAVAKLFEMYQKLINKNNK
jgi:type I restriction-modification system DNA methylase subunit